MTRPLRRVVLPALCFLVAACGGGGPTLPGSSPAPLPEAPGSFTAELTPDGTVLLRWASPAPTPGRASVTGYAVYLESSGSRPVLLGRTGSLSYRWSGHPSIGLDLGRRYVFHVRAESDIGLSQASASAFVDVPFPPLPPLAPGNLTAQLTANAEALLRWSEPPPSPNRVPVAGYAVYREVPGGDAELLGITDALSYLHPGLIPDNRYVFHVRALSSEGQSLPSSSASVDVLPGLPPFPEAPGSFAAELTGIDDKLSTEVLLTWEAPTPAPNRAPVTDYVVCRELPGGGGGEAEGQPCPGAEFRGRTSSLSVVDTGLLPGRSYVYFVRASSSVGFSLPSSSDVVDVRVGPIVPLAVPHVTVWVDERYDERSQMSQPVVVISWIHRLAPEIPAVVAGFEVQYCDIVDVAAHRSLAPDLCIGGWRDHAFSPLADPTIRTFKDQFSCDHPRGRMYRVRALSDDPSASSRYSVPSPPVCPTNDFSPPGRVDAVFALDLSPEGESVQIPGTVNICWEVPVHNGDRPLHYELQVQSTTGPELPAFEEFEDGWVIVDARIGPDPRDPGERACHLYSGLKEGETYWFRVRAYNLAGHGHWSAPYHYEHEFVPPSSSGSSAENGVALSIADARARESRLAMLTFEVTLDRAATEPVTVDYATSDGTATAGEDYRSTSGTLTFAVGETSKTVEVPVLPDTKEEGIETLALHLANALGARIEDGEATGTIEDRDPLPKAWLARFGRTVAGHAVDAVGARVAGTLGTHVTVGGMSFGFADAPGAAETLHPRGTASERDAWRRPREAPSLATRQLLSGSSFHLASQDGDGPIFAAWGRFATGDFESDVHDMRLDGAATTGFLGADVEGDRWLAGAALSHTEADGSFVPGSATATGRSRRDVESTLTGIFPYARLTLNERVALWGLAGSGRGTLTLAEPGRAPVETDIDMSMGALGARGTVLSPPDAGGFELAVRSDALWARMASDEADSGAAVHLPDIRADATRLRLAVEGARAFPLAGDGTLTPTFEVGLRHDGGDAETGTGIDAGAGIRYDGDGVAIEGSVRRLVAHEESGYEAWGASASVRIDPGASGRGLSLTLAPTIGAGSGGSGRLHTLDVAPGLAEHARIDTGRRLEARFGYGLGLRGTRGTLTPYTGFSLTGDGTRSWRVGARVTMAPDVTLRLEGMHREHDADTSDRSIALRGGLYW